MRPICCGLAFVTLFAWATTHMALEPALLQSEETVEPSTWVVVERDGQACLDQTALPRWVWQTAVDWDKLLRHPPLFASQGGDWIERLARYAPPVHGRWLTLAALHRKDGFEPDVRLRLARLLAQEPGRTDEQGGPGAVENAPFEGVEPPAVAGTRPIDRPTREISTPGIESGSTPSQLDIRQQLLALDPPGDLRLPFYLELAFMASLRGDAEQVDRALLAALGDESDPPGAWCNAARQLLADDRPSASRALLVALCDGIMPPAGIAAPEDAAAALLRLAIRQFRQGDDSRTRDLLAALLDRFDPSLVTACEGSVWLGRAEERTGSSARARERYRWVLDSCSGPDDLLVRALFGLGRSCLHDDDLRCAEEAFARLLDGFPTCSHGDDALFYLAQVSRQRGRPDQELQLIEAALRLPVDGDLWREAVWRRVADELQQGRLDVADQLLRRAISAFDWDSTYYSQGRFEYFLGRIQAESGDRGQAASWWREAIARYPLTYYAALSCRALETLGEECPWPVRSTTSPAACWPVGECLQQEGRWLDLARIGELEQAAEELQQVATSCPQAAWIRALLLNLAADYSTSHDIPRRQIPGWQAGPLPGNEHLWEVAYPRPYLKQVIAEAARCQLDPALVYAVMREESGFRSRVHSYAGAQGLMQLMPSTARGHAEEVEGEVTVERLADPAVNIRIGANVLAHLQRRLGGELVLMVAAYNAGRGAVNRWLGERPLQDEPLWVEQIPSTQTRNYTKRVLGSYQVYRYLYGGRWQDRTGGVQRSATSDR